jgi:hypothetical protein
MNVDEVKITLTGKYKIENLENLGYKTGHFSDGFAYYFDGKLHRYVFIPKTINKIIIKIGQKPFSDVSLIPEITFGNMSDWVLESVKAIELDSD